MSEASIVFLQSQINKAKSALDQCDDLSILCEPTSVGQYNFIQAHICYRRLPHALLGQIYELDSTSRPLRLTHSWLETDLQAVQDKISGTRRSLRGYLRELEESLKEAKASAEQAQNGSSQDPDDKSDPEESG